MKRAVIVGSGPNGLSAAVALAQVGVSVTVYEAEMQHGGSARTEALTLPGFRHDTGSTVFPLGVASPFFRSLPLEQHGLAWVEPEVPLAHPLDDGSATGLLHSLGETAALLREDGPAWTSLIAPLLKTWPALLGDALRPVVRWPALPFQMAGFGLHALLSAKRLAERFKTPAARTMFAGLAAHSVVPLDYLASAAPALVLGGAAHATGWPIARGGSQSIADALVSLLRALGGEIVTGHRVGSLAELGDADAVLLDVTPQQFLQLSDCRLSARQSRPFQNFKRSAGICKVDWALSQPIPWTAELCRRAGTVHLGGSFAEIASSERDAWMGRRNERPFVLLAQPSLLDSSRAPEGRHTAWAYCHVPNGSPEDATACIERQIERFAPGFTETILARATHTAPQMQEWNANLLGGDVSGGAMTLEQIIRRPTLPPYRTPLEGVFLCSSSTPPGGGVHGMCGYGAAVAAAAHIGLRLPRL